MGDFSDNDDDDDKIDSKLKENIERIEVTPLGAGKDVGRSCLILSFFSRSKLEAQVLLDCGLHVGFTDKQAFPDFKKVDFRQVDGVLVTHYHIDHCGAIPALTEREKYTGKIIMSGPTKALLPMMLEDQLKPRGFTSQEIRTSTEKCTAIETRQTYILKPDLEITSFRAGHVLGAVIFHVRFRNASAIYTGDFNATPDRHLGAYEFCPVPANLPPPDCVITESTYGSTTRGSQRSSEREFLDQVHSCLLKGGKVLIPTFAMGRVQEIVSLLESHWDRMNLLYPIILCTKEAASVADVYRFYEDWGTSRVAPPENNVEKETGVRKFVQLREPTQMELEEPGPLVLIATSAMLVGGLSLKAFRIWASNEKNSVVFPGHCVRGTLGHDLLELKNLSGKLQDNSNKSTIEVRCCSSTAPFSAHTDSKGICQLVHQLKPRNCILVHGVEVQMQALKRRIEQEIPSLQNAVFYPGNFETVKIKCTNPTTTTTTTTNKKKARCELLLKHFVCETKEFDSLLTFKTIVSERFQKEQQQLSLSSPLQLIFQHEGIKICSNQSNYFMELKWSTDGKAHAYHYKNEYESVNRNAETIPKWMEIAERSLSE